MLPSSRSQLHTMWLADYYDLVVHALNILFVPGLRFEPWYTIFYYWKISIRSCLHHVWSASWFWFTYHCPACRTTLVATRFRVAVICPIIQVPHCIRVFFYFVWFVFINHIFQFYYELCTYCNILDIYLSWNLNFVNYVLFYMKLLNYLFFSMFGSVLESCELTGVCLLLPWLIKWK